MRPRSTSLLFALVRLGVFLAISSAEQADPQPPAQPPGVEVLARGPVHEAFAEPTDVRPQPSPVVPKQPPDPIEEMPPDQKPEGDNVQWIPGYWSWDDTQNDYIWVSGFWRIPPPARQWVPGYWQAVEGGWQWTPGFWNAQGQQEVQYVPPPPPTVDAGPSVPAPDDTSTYVPGCWIFSQVRFLWRPGFWIPYRPGWLWTPAQYLWSPSGYIFQEGFWDHPFEERGLLFAPVRIDPRVLATPGWSYVPQYVVQPDFLISALFVRPTHHHYYFGNYFEDGFARRGFVPWVDYQTSRHSYDPNFSYYRHQFARTPGWEQGLRDLYHERRSGAVPRPPDTLIQQEQVMRNITANKTANVAIHKNIPISHMQNVQALAPLAQFHNTRVTNLAALGQGKTPAGVKETRPGPGSPRAIHLTAVSTAQRVQEQKAGRQIHQAAQQRRQAEGKIVTQGAAPVKPTDQPRNIKLPVGRPAAPATPKVPAKAPAKVPPPPPTLPRHEVKPTPKHEPPKAPAPPKGQKPQAPQPKPPAQPAPHPQPKPPAPPPHPAPQPKPPPRPQPPPHPQPQPKDKQPP